MGQDVTLPNQHFIRVISWYSVINNRLVSNLIYEHTNALILWEGTYVIIK